MRDEEVQPRALCGSRSNPSELRLLLEKLPVGAYTCDADGLITYFNPHAVNLWGRAPSLNDPLDRFCGSFKLFAADGSPIAHDRCWMALALRDGREYNGEEILIERPDGSRVTALAHANPIHDDAGKLIGAVNVLVDISDRRRAAEAQAQLCEQLRDADRRKDEFLAMLAHELRNPLAPISNSLEILRLTDDLSPAVARVREIMHTQVNHMVRLVDDLLEVSRIAQGKIELRKMPVKLSTIVGSAVETSRPFIDAAKHQLAIAVPHETLMLDADPVRLSQVISNLLNNAAKYTPEGGQIWLTARQDRDEVALSVRDNGLGIPADMLPHVFEMFAQLDETHSRAQGGLGIGLTLAKTFVEMHDGRVEVRSGGPGQGSEFIVRLPLAAQSSISKPVPAPEQEQRPLTARRILVVDDTRAAAYTLSKLLESLGQQVSTAHDGVSALDFVRNQRPDVVISDIAMPDMSGYELARSLRQHPSLDSVILVALTGYGQDADTQRAREAGFDYHLVKPMTMDALHHLLKLLEPVPSHLG